MTSTTSSGFRPVPVLAFLALTLGFTWTLEILLISDGLRFDDLVAQSAPALWLMGVMWIPGLVGLAVAGFMERTRPGGLVSSLNLRLGSVGPYFAVVLLIPLAYGIMYLLTYGAGLSGYDPNLSLLAALTGTEIDPASVFEVMLPLSVVLGPLINFTFGLGEELGWRGFLLPRLMPLGKPTAYVLLGLLWGLWHAPLIYAGFNYPGYPVGGMIMMCLLCTAFGLFLNEMTLHYRSSLLAGFIHGTANAQGYGIWMWLFPDAHPLLGGSAGLTGVLVWLVVSGLAMAALSRLKRD
ncbi:MULTISPECIES: CPBP family intramembrane glutamic endopeptidase [unclassified Pseudodesulfovibrio]|uniref:CPBP family intramembrane glutamic endopeptidase n=1 Tax=unclassified Pseudodesulfovibrio TaxID=2661612 RepID=UPI000FEC1729|nr:MULTISPECIES: CPBP family intramembrane glutamic endopeptidase [unclassified Pseudodesulfovibrio]MCJ2165041.1 CPBP family intramembrane metalloprotease [Pseudodesulfovibrio sp. S3-i]RWU03518.1 CPBP family intramembrane metalloprotease [Pseudodesulfovibrio sp. S3]